MAFCTVCGEENPDDSQFCGGCGNNLKEETMHVMQKGQDNTPMQYQPVQYEPVEFKVEQKMFSLSATYKVKNAMDTEFMVVRKKLFSPFRPFLEVKHSDGSPFGYIQANMWRTEWKVFDVKNQLLATVRFPFFMMFRKRFSVETADGNFNSGSSFFAYKFDVYDQAGQISFLVDKKIFSLRDTFLIKTFGGINPFIVCLVSITIDQRFHSGGDDRSFAMN